MKNYISLNELKVGLDFGGDILPVGRLANRAGKIYFEYDAAFLKTGLNISPLRLPPEPGLKTFDPILFEGLPGVFNDSLPDGWGRLLFDRLLRSEGILVGDISPLDRLAHVGLTGIGALVYEPDYSSPNPNDALNLNILAAQTREALTGEAENVLQELLALNGSSAGARPKAMIGVDASRKNILNSEHTLPEGFEHWLVKFSNSSDGDDAGAIEYVYSLMAKEAGLEMMPTHLFPAEIGSGYFATKRFDRNGKRRLHTHTVCGLLHSDFRTPSVDYEDLLTLTEVVTRDVREVEKMFRLAVFNVLAHNRDDHSKNFTFLMNEAGDWKLSPAYDLTFSSGPRGEQSTMVMGEGKNPGVEHLIELGGLTKISRTTITQIISDTKQALDSWESLAKKYGVTQANIRLIANKIGAS
ncbi:MAG: type II toxin-antitoxin system HipA family toxin [Alphaproteobacteria bacterium]|nr:type II toxin-antitoxin system HipA family toxin [Alphaproteobacteria bacterium]MBO6629518.1 type II toxin-antitoxin system HipA family toxin [Alphaproteobacteria bacterium]MDF1625807.1 type II toxin-antitoxin system HipA family toxin [Parvibaculaceae bacterium]